MFGDMTILVMGELLIHMLKVKKKLGKYSNYIQTVIKTGYMFKVVNHDEKEK